MYRKSEGKLVRDSDANTRRLNFNDNRLTGGGFGLASTVDSARMLKPSTVKLMCTDQLDPRITERLFLPTKGSVGFGLDFPVRVSQPQKPEENRGADPANHISAVFFTWKMPFDGTLHHDIRGAIYGPTYLGPRGD
jgi:hypothetical protein